MSQYIDRREAAKSYRPIRGSMSPGLKRAREPYRLRNTLVGVSLAAFAVGVWAYSISAVKQDVFDDVDEEVMKASHTASDPTSSPSPSPSPSSSSSSLSSSSSTTTSPTSTPTITSAPVSAAVEPKSSPILDEMKANASTTSRGVLPRLLDTRLTWLLDPKQKTLVWGAPPVDDLGKMGRRS